MPAFLKQKTFLILVGLFILFVVSVGVAYWYTQKGDEKTSKNDQENTQVPETSQEEQISSVRWENTSDGGWLALSSPPDCPEPFSLKAPADLSKATSVLYPGQERQGTFSGAGGNYKPHGGFRFDSSALADIKVTSPINGYVYRGSQYLIEGEIQYTFDLIHPCGYMIRLGHLRELSPTFQTYASKFPAAQEEDSRTERIEGFPIVKEGDLVATAVGLPPSNTFFDLGVYDLRKQNEISQTAAYQTAHSDAKELAFYAICWFELLPKADSEKVRNLPAADPASGKKSDYCK